MYAFNFICAYVWLSSEKRTRADAKDEQAGKGIM
jgi:hypothetical protein